MRLFSFGVVVVAIVCACLCGVDARWTELSAGGRDEPVTSGTCGANVNWNFDKNTHILTLTGSGDMNSSYGNGSPENIPWYPLRSEIQKVVVSEGITSIANISFVDCSSLTTVELPQSVTVIGYTAFWKCGKLKSIKIPDKVTVIDHNTFEACSSLTTVVLPENLKSIEGIAFYQCSSLTSINIPDKVTKIGGIAFKGCSSLRTIKIPESVTLIESGAFAECSNLTSINIPDKVTSIESSTFSECSSLTTIGKIPEGVTSIGSYAFSECSKLTSINIPDKVTKIGTYAFYKCLSLTSITIPENVTEIGNRAFVGCSNLKSVGFYGTSIMVPTPDAPAAVYLFSKPPPLVCVPDEYNSTKFCEVEVSRNSSCSALYNKNICDEAVFDVDKNEWVLVEKTGCQTTSPVFAESRSDRIQILVVMVCMMTFMFTIILH